MGDYVSNFEYYKVVSEKVKTEAVTERTIIGKLDVPLINIEYTMNVEFDKQFYTASWNLVNSDKEK